MSRTIWLARHGVTDWNLKGRKHGVTEVPMNNAGFRQVGQLIRTLQEMPKTVVSLYSSPLIRAAQGAEVLASALQVGAFGYLEELRERDFGKAEGLNRAAMEYRWRDRSLIPGYESDESVWARLEPILRIAPGRSLLFTHTGVIRVALERVMGRVAPSGSIAPCSVWEFELGEFGSIQSLTATGRVA